MASAPLVLFANIVRNFHIENGSPRRPVRVCRSRTGPRVSSATRIAAAAVGGALFGIGSQFARGCTSGAALSGMAVLSAGGILTMMAIFGSAYATAYFVRKLWI